MALPTTTGTGVYKGKAQHLPMGYCPLILDEELLLARSAGEVSLRAES
jgi:hypothetical protein